MKIVEISAFLNYSVGNIMQNIKEEVENNGDECFIFYGRGNQSSDKSLICFNNKVNIYIDAIKARILDNDGLNSIKSTNKLISMLENINPDIVHIHCLHGYYINFEILLNYFKEAKIKVVWTMHDTWAFTGHCCYFDSVGCNKWENECYECVAKKDYPKSILFDRSKQNFNKKKEIFTSLDNDKLTIISPCSWMDNNVSKSFLNIYKHKVIYNGISTQLFKNFNYNREKTLIAVASVWDRRKNLNKVLEISNYLNEWKIIVVGKVNKKIVNKYYEKIQFIDRTTNLDELVNLYNTALILINPTIDDNFPTVNIEAQLCGCRVLSYNVGGIPETDLGLLTIMDYEDKIDDKYLDNVLGNHALDLEKKFDKKDMAKQYYDLFKTLY